MAVYYKFKSAKDYDSIAIDGHFISVAILKERIFESKHLGRGTDFDLVVTNAQTNEEYLDEATMIPKNTSVLIRRVPGRPRMPIFTQPDEPKIESNAQDEQPPKSNFVTTESSALNDREPSEWDDDFGHDLYATIPEVTPVQAGNSVQDALPPNKDDEDSKIKALIETPALDWQRQGADGYGSGRGFVRGGRMMPGRGFGRGIMERKTPPPGYVCHRCKIPGHYIQHCPTNGDPNYDVRRVKPPTGIPRSMLIANPDGSYALPSGAVAVLKPNEAAFEKEIEGLPSTRSVGELPPELHCPLCKEVMKDAVLTSKCCFESFCDKCIRDYIISKSKCVCGATDVLADDLLPNKTLRDTINRILESNNNGSAENAGSFIEVPDMMSARGPQPRHPSPSQSAASKGEQLPLSRVEEVAKSENIANEEKAFGSPQQQLPHQASEKGKAPKIPDVSEATHESLSVKEPASQGSALLADEEVQQRSAAAEAGKKKKKKKARLPMNAADMQWRNPQDLAAENYMMGMGPSPYNPYWGGMQPPMDPYMAPFPGHMPFNMGYNVGPMDMPPFGGMMPPDPFGASSFMYPPFPQRDLAELVPGFNARPPLMSREEFEARKADLRRKREMERRAEREMPRDRDPPGREMSRMSGDAAPMRPISNPVHREPSHDRYDRDTDRSRYRDDRDHDRDRHQSNHHRPERVSVERSTRDSDLPHPPSKRKSDNLHSREEDHSHAYDQDHHHEKEKERDHERESDRDRKRDRDRERVHDKERDHDGERDHDHERDRRRHHRSESTIKASPPAAELPPALSKSSSAAAAAAAAERKHKASVFSRISFPAEEPNKKRKVSSSSSAELKALSKEHDAGGSSSHHHRSTAAAVIAASDGYQEESSDDDRHFKRRPSRYEPSPPRHKKLEEDEEVRHSRSSRERERERDRGSHASKHR
ncbi:hypothetical protein Droror1_Dr00005284 [Drosera rotundifolia]